MPSSTIRPVFEDEHAIGDLDRREPVGDDHRGPVREQRSQRALHQPLRRDVERRRRFVEDEHRGVGEERTGERDELALPGRQPRALLVDVGVVAVGQRGDELVRRRSRAPPRRSPRRSRRGGPRPMLSATDPVKRKFSCVTVTIAPVEVGFGRDRAGRCRRASTRPTRRIPEARREAGDRRLARAGRADERDGLARGDVEIEMRAAPCDRGTRTRTPSNRQRTARLGQRHRVRGLRAPSAASSRTPDSFSSPAAAAWNRL